MRCGAMRGTAAATATASQNRNLKRFFYFGMFLGDWYSSLVSVSQGRKNIKKKKKKKNVSGNANASPYQDTRVQRYMRLV